MYIYIYIYMAYVRSLHGKSCPVIALEPHHKLNCLVQNTLQPEGRHGFSCRIPQVNPLIPSRCSFHGPTLVQKLPYHFVIRPFQRCYCETSARGASPLPPGWCITSSGLVSDIQTKDLGSTTLSLVKSYDSHRIKLLGVGVTKTPLCYR